ncbi:MAG TPA: YncE family protein [Caulobacteraceae bacterium]|jgi:DNA-binding beta-propeller fold protein YncE
MFKPIASLAALWLSLALAAAAPAQAADPPTPQLPGPGHYRIVQTIPGDDAFWDYATIIPEEHRLYLGREDGVSVLDLRTGKLTPVFVPGKQVHAIVPLPHGRALFTQGATGLATVFDRATGKVIRDIQVGVKPDGAVRDPATGQVIVLDGTRDEVIFVDPDQGRVLGRIKVEGEPDSAVLDGKGHLYFNITDRSETAVVDLATRKLVRRIPLPDCQDASPLALDKARGVFVAGCANLKVVAFDAATGRILGTAPIGKYPDVISFDPVRQVFYAPTVIPGGLAVVGLRRNGSPETLASLPVAFGVHTGAIDAAAGRLYLPAGQLKLTPGQRPVVTPGTFKIYVIDVSQAPPRA